MRYKELEHEIEKLVGAASEASRMRFAKDSVRVLASVASPHIAMDFNENEQQLLVEILHGIDKDDFGGLEAKFAQLYEGVSSDDIKAIELHPDIIEAISAIDHLLKYVTTRNADFIAKIAINTVNSIDYRNQLDINNMLADPRMFKEFERWRRTLVQK